MGWRYVSFRCRMVTQGKLVLTNKNWHYSKVCTVVVNTGTGRALMKSDLQLHTDDLWIRSWP